MDHMETGHVEAGQGTGDVTSLHLQNKLLWGMF